MKKLFIILALCFVSCNGYDTECIEGHKYYVYRKWFFHISGIAPKLNDNGLPVRCEDYKK